MEIPIECSRLTNLCGYFLAYDSVNSLKVNSSRDYYINLLIAREMRHHLHFLGRQEKVTPQLGIGEFRVLIGLRIMSPVTRVQLPLPGLHTTFKLPFGHPRIIWIWRLRVFSAPTAARY